jgi:glutathionyl-hydroquinone reductase
MQANAQFPAEQGETGDFERQEDAFRGWISREAGAAHPVEPGRYHLYVSLACPWAHRTLIVRHLQGLERAVGMTVVDPVRDDRGWAFRDGPGQGRDPINGFQFLKQAYEATRPGYAGRVTVPVLWDKEAGVLVNNSEDDICQMFNGVLAPLGRGAVDLFPASLEEEQSALSRFIYDRVNNGVYRAGFATTQTAYKRKARRLFQALDELEGRLSRRRYLLGDQVLEVDWRLFCTLVRFDPVYHGHFKCNLRRIIDYPNLSGYLRDLYQKPGIAATVNFDHIKRHYYMTHDDINPTRIVPIGPELDLEAAHGREHLNGPSPGNLC